MLYETMEFPVEGNYTPNFTESECSISIQGIVWNERSPRSFRETPRIISPNNVTGDSRLKAFNAQRTGDTPRPAEELPSVESIIERVCSQMCNDLRRSGALRDEVVDTVHAQVYSQLSSRCIRRSTDPHGSTPASPVGGRSSAKYESRVRQNRGGNTSSGERDSVGSRAAATERSVVKSANSLYTWGAETSQESRNSSRSSCLRSSRTGSACSETASTSRSISLTSTDMTRSGTPEHAPRGTSASRAISSRESVLEPGINKDRHTPSPSIRQTSSPVIQSIESTPRSSKSRTPENVQDRPKSIKSASKDDITELMCPSKLAQKNSESPTNIGRESACSRSDVSHIPVRTRTQIVMDFAQITRKEDKFRQASSPLMYSTCTSPPKSLGSGHFGDNTDRHKSVETEIKRGDSPALKENAHDEIRIIDKTEDKSSKLGSETPRSPQTPTRVSSSRSSKIPIRSVTPEITEPATAKPKDDAKRISKVKCKDPDTNVKESRKSVSRRENNASNGTVNKAKKKESVPKAGSKKEEMSALERRKAYEAGRKLERKVALAAKTVERTEIASKKQINKNRNIDEFKRKARKDPIVKTEVSITEKKNCQIDHIEVPVTKKPCHNENDFTYEDDFEPMEEEINQHHKSAVDTRDVKRNVAPVPAVSQIEMETANHDVNPASSVKDDHTEGKPNNIPRLNFMTDKEIHGLHMDMAFGRVAAESGRANPGSTRSDVDFGYLGHPATFNVPVQSQSGYNPEYCLVHMHPSIAHVYDNLDPVPGYKRVKEPTRRKAGKRSSNADENEHVRRKPPNTKKKTTVVGYVPGYGAVRVMKEDSGQVCLGGRKHNSNSTSFRVIENHLNTGRKQRLVVGYVPGYGPVRGQPVKAFPEVPSERVVLPPLNINQAHGCHGDVKRSKKGRDKKRGTDLLEARARAKPFNTYVDEEASRRFERQYTRHR